MEGPWGLLRMVSSWREKRSFLFPVPQGLCVKFRHSPIVATMVLALVACSPEPPESRQASGGAPLPRVSQDEMPPSRRINRPKDLINQEYTTRQWEGFLNPGRDAIYQPERVLEVLGVRSGMVVGDIGAGSGYFTFHLSGAVGPEGRVYAIDAQSEGLDFIRKALDSRNSQAPSNVEIVVNQYDDICLPEETLDLGLMCEVHIHSFAELVPESRAMIASTFRALKPGAKLAIIERKIKPVQTSVEIIAGHYAEAGFELVGSYDFIEPCYFLVLQKPE